MVRLAEAMKQGGGAAEMLRGDDGDEADAHVEGAEHLVLGHVAELAEMFKDGQNGPGAELDLGGGAGGQDAGQIFRDAAAGDVGHAADEFGAGELLEDGQVAAVGGEQDVCGAAPESGDALAGLVAGDLEEELAGQRVTVGVESGGGQSEEDVSGADGGAGDHLVALDDADDEAGQIVFAILIEAGHLGGFPADEGAVVGAAGGGEAFDDLLEDGGLELAAGQVVEEEERRGTLDGDVVDAVVDEVGADGGVDAELEGELELGADTVSRADEDGILPLAAVERVKRSKAADPGQDVAVERGGGEGFDAVLGTVTGGDVHTGIGVTDRTDRLGFGHANRFPAHGGDGIGIRLKG